MKWKTVKKLPELSADITSDVEFLNDQPKTVTLLRAGVPFLRISKPESYSDSLAFAVPEPPKTKEVFFVHGIVNGRDLNAGPFDSERDANLAISDLNFIQGTVKKETVPDLED